MDVSWGYGRYHAPSTWKEVFPAAGGKRQSPININSKTTEYDVTLSVNPLFLYIPKGHTNQELKPNFHSFTIHAENPSSRLRGGPLGNDAHFEFFQFHFHWSDTDYQGSEHTLDGRTFTGEAHFVFWNSKKYKKFEEAAPESDGLAVMAFFIKISDSDNELLNPLFKVLLGHSEHDALKEQFISDPIDIESIIKQSDLTKYYTYCGSLTTPPCFESVQWMIFAKELRLSSRQLNLLRSTHAGHICGCGVQRNFRPACPINDRKVRASFKQESTKSCHCVLH